MTGGLGSDPSIEGFGPDHDLPSLTGYAETCAAIGLVRWAQRMNALTGEARYVDVLERALHNGVLAGASSDGTCYFYGNPLASRGGVTRQEWFGVACCPPNLARLLGELGRYVYAVADDAVVVNLFVAGRARVVLAGGEVVVHQTTEHPRDGLVQIRVEAGDRTREVTLLVRVPGWSREPTARLSGRPLDVAPGPDGYLRITRTWGPDDVLELDLGMEPVRVWAHPAVADAAGRVALERGPVVYCLEGVDQEGPVGSLVLPRSAALDTRPDARTGLVTLHADARRDVTDEDVLYLTSPPERRSTSLTAVPYFSWGNRGDTDMTVWVREA